MIREGAIRIPFSYAAGRAGSRFLRALRDEDRIVGAECAACARVWCPPRTYCPRCGGEALTERNVGPGGAVVSWTTLADGGTLLLVRLDGADSALLHHWIGEAGAVAVGDRVVARFAAERAGSIHDLAGFAPEEGGEA